MTVEHKKYLRKAKLYKLAIHACRILLLILLPCLWEYVAVREIIDPFIISSPSRIAKTIIMLYKSGALFPHIWASLTETVLGFLLATFFGTLFAVLLWWCKPLREVLEPYIITLNSLPKIALGPLIIIWFGIGKKAIIFMAVLICIIITVIGMLAGFCAVDNEKIMLMRSFRSGKGKTMLKLIFPANMPNLISVLKINVGLSWVGSIMGEYLSSQEGLGYLIVYGSQVFQLDLVMASTLILCMLAALMYSFVALAEKVVKKRFGL